MRAESNGTNGTRARTGATGRPPGGREDQLLFAGPPRGPRETGPRTLGGGVTNDRGPAGLAVGDDEYVLSLGAVALALYRRLWVILLTVLVLAAAAVGVGSLQTPSYDASIKILVGQRQQGDAQTANLAGDVEGLQQLTLTMTEAVDSRPVAEATIERLGLRTDYEEFREHLTVEQVPETQFVLVSYRASDPEEASRVANAIGSEFTDQVTKVSPSANSITATVWERAVPPDEPASPNLLQYALLAATFGLMLGTALAFLLERLDDRWRSPEEAERVSGLPTFGTIPAFSAPAQKTRKKGES